MVPTLNTTLAQHPHVIAQLLPHEAVLLLPARGEVKVLNDVGARIWTAMNGARTVHEIADLIYAEYAIDRTQAQHDTLCFVDDLLRRELVVLVSSP